MASRVKEDTSRVGNGGDSKPAPKPSPHLSYPSMQPRG
jgi:hypothetical protein